MMTGKKKKTSTKTTVFPRNYHAIFFSFCFVFIFLNFTFIFACFYIFHMIKKKKKDYIDSLKKNISISVVKYKN